MIHNMCCFSPHHLAQENPALPPSDTSLCVSGQPSPWRFHGRPDPSSEAPKTPLEWGKLALVGCLNHLEQYEYNMKVNGKDDIPHMKWKIIQPCLKPPTRANLIPLILQSLGRAVEFHMDFLLPRTPSVPTAVYEIMAL